MSRSRGAILPLLWLLTTATAVELVVLRTVTRTLVHVPGTERYETPIRLLAEAGRLAYYVAAVSLVAALAVLAWIGISTWSSRHMATGATVVVFLAVAAAGRAEVLSWRVVGWVMLATLVLVGLIGWRGLRSVPVGLFVIGFVTAGVSVIAQTVSSGITGGQVDSLVWASELALVAAGLTAPLLLKRSPSRAAWVIGAVAATVALGAFASAASTVTILVLWNVGVPGWLPGLAYAVALGTLTATIWSAGTRAELPVAIGLVLLIAGGVGLISTYQTGLALVGVLLLGQFGESLSLSVRGRGTDLGHAGGRSEPITVAVGGS
jgi:hypothetical protein